jgi:hypothetical protein
VDGLKELDDASYSKVAYPHPFVSGNHFESFTMKHISVCGPGSRAEVQISKLVCLGCEHAGRCSW